MSQTKRTQQVARTERYVAQHGTCCMLYTRQYGCSSHGRPPASGYLKDEAGRSYVLVAGRRQVGEVAKLHRHHV